LSTHNTELIAAASSTLGQKSTIQVWLLKRSSNIRQVGNFVSSSNSNKHNLFTVKFATHSALKVSLFGMGIMGDSPRPLFHFSKRSLFLSPYKLFDYSLPG